MNKNRPNLTVVQTAQWKLDFLASLAKMDNDELLDTMVYEAKKEVGSEQSEFYGWKREAAVSEIKDRMVWFPRGITK